MRNRNDNSEIEILCTLIFLLQFAWLIHPDAYLDEPPLYKMYCFSSQLITAPTWLDYGFRNISYLIAFYLMTKFIPGMSDRLGIFFWLWLGYLFEYLLCYNEPFTRIPLAIGSITLFTLPVSYSLFAGLTMIFITLYDILKK